jgi:hypothetical protein
MTAALKFLSQKADDLFEKQMESAARRIGGRREAGSRSGSNA